MKNSVNHMFLGKRLFSTTKKTEQQQGSQQQQQSDEGDKDGKDDDKNQKVRTYYIHYVKATKSKVGIIFHVQFMANLLGTQFYYYH